MVPLGCRYTKVCGCGQDGHSKQQQTSYSALPCHHQATHKRGLARLCLSLSPPFLRSIFFFTESEAIAICLNLNPKGESYEVALKAVKSSHCSRTLCSP